MKKVLFSMFIAAALSACSSTSKENDVIELTAAQKEELGYECEKVKITGSKLPRKVCTTAAKRAEMKRQDQENFRKGIRTGGGSKAGL